MTALTLPAPAKLNLFLHVTGRRPDGYHLLQTVFQLLDYGDELHFEPADTLSLQPALPGVDPQHNLITKAARALQAASGCRQGARITLNKRLPMGGGLGGGSSDAATTLLGLNHLWRTGLSIDQLAAIGLTLGADVPVFVRGHSAWAEGVGEILTPVTLPEQWFVVLTPPVLAETARIFSAPELTRHTSPITIAAFLDRGGHNDCEPVACALYPAIASTRDWLSRFGPARMTGTGSSVFCPMPTREAAEAVLQQCPAGINGFVARGTNRSMLHRKLESV
ncbi:MAG: 4-(cytidine 5'-diphospho)-2-C-methyl-D-erythritol kinase [Gammaproteobacteria bacterium]|nr:MAG: 4-(cytidine 5'-diphospho)-2-C-methyl-D-erythritol kinase [Gammaproteobacteria bacterium]